jgi:CBS domain containing-hemolysin-like protein
MDAHLGAAQLGITIASLGLGWLGEPALAGLFAVPLDAVGAPPDTAHALAIGTAFAILSTLHIVVGELVPKSLAIRRAERLARATAGALHGFYVVTWPFMFVLNGLSNLILRAIGLPPVGTIEGALSAEEIRLIVRASFEGGAAEEQKRALLERVLAGTDAPARAIMVPRVDMVVVPADATIADVAAALRKHGFSRYPMCTDGDPDHVVGYVHVKDVAAAADEPDAPASRLRRDVSFTPTTRSVGELLSEFQLGGNAIAIVVDEYGGTAGLVTVEDVLEQLVGDIQDEDDEPQPTLVAREDGTWLADGALAVEAITLEGFARPDGIDAATLAGVVVAAIGRLARPGDRVRIGALDLEVLEVRRRRVGRIRIARAAPPSVRPPAGG